MAGRWVSFDDWVHARGLTFAHLPTTAEDRFADHVVTQPPPPEPKPVRVLRKRKQPSERWCPKFHSHARHRPSKRCECTCTAWCRRETEAA